MLPNRATHHIYGSTLVTFTLPFPTTKVEFVANKAKGANHKTGVTSKQSTLNFPKNKRFLPPDTRK